MDRTIWRVTQIRSILFPRTIHRQLVLTSKLPALSLQALRSRVHFNVFHVAQYDELLGKDAPHNPTVVAGNRSVTRLKPKTKLVRLAGN